MKLCTLAGAAQHEEQKNSGRTRSASRGAASAASHRRPGAAELALRVAGAAAANLALRLLFMGAVGAAAANLALRLPGAAAADLALRLASPGPADLALRMALAGIDSRCGHRIMTSSMLIGKPRSRIPGFAPSTRSSSCRTS